MWSDRKKAKVEERMAAALVTASAMDASLNIDMRRLLR